MKTATLATPENPTSETRRAVASDLAESPLDGQPVSEDTVRLHAFWNWALAGKPEGEDLKFWLEAERQLLQGKQTVT